MDEMEQPPEQPVAAPVEVPAPAAPAPVVDASVLDKIVTFYLPTQPLGKMVRRVASELGVSVGNVPAADAEPLISYLRADGEPGRAVLETLARVAGGKWSFDGALHFVLS